MSLQVRRLLPLAMVVVLGLIAGAWFYFSQQRSADRFWGTMTDPQVRSEYERRWERLGELPELPLASEQSVRAALLGAEVHDSTLSEERVRSALETVAEFIHMRFVQEDPEAYIRWVRERGCVQQDWEFLEAAYTVSLGYPKFTGEPFPEDAAQEEVFADLFLPVIEWKDGHNRPVAITESPGVAIATGTLREGDIEGNDMALLGGTLGEDLWHGHGANIRSGRRGAWWVPEQDHNEIMERYGEVDYAIVGAVMEMADGTRTPFRFTLFWNPERSLWQIEALDVTLTIAARSSVGFY